MILGGTKFLGRALSEDALARRHELTLFNRGRDRPGALPRGGAPPRRPEDAISPRSTDARGTRWSTPSGYVPARRARVGGAAARLRPLRLRLERLRLRRLRDRARARRARRPSSATMPADELAPDFSNYGPLKALSEAEVEHVFGERALIVRPGLIVGPHDPTGRFTYWAHRLERGGEILAPGPQERHGAVRRRARPGRVDPRRGRAPAARAPSTRPTRACPGASCSPAPTSPGSPTSSCRSTGSARGWSCRSGSPAQSGPACTGPTSAARSRPACAFRPLAETLRGAADAPLEDGVGLTPEREAELLDAWHSR